MGDSILVLIPLAPFLLAGFAIWTRHNRKIEEIRATATAEKAAQYAAQNQVLEARVQVLERIVTDRGYDVATQIEALRDSRQAEGRQAEGRQAEGRQAERRLAQGRSDIGAGHA